MLIFKEFDLRVHIRFARQLLLLSLSLSSFFCAGISFWINHRTPIVIKALVFLKESETSTDSKEARVKLDLRQLG